MSSQPQPGITPGDFSADELLAEAERRARQLLGPTSPAVAATLVAGWPDVLQAASEVLDPDDTHRHLGHPYHPARPDRTRRAGALVDQLIMEATAVGGPNVPTVSHPDLQRIIGTWQQSAAMLRRPGSEQPVSASDHTRVELRVIRTLAVLAHVTQVSLHGARPPRPFDPAEGALFRRMTQRHEQLAIRCLRQLTATMPEQPTGQEADLAAAMSPRPTPTNEQSPAERSASEPAVRQVSVANQLLIGLRQWAPLAIVIAADPNSSVRDLRRIAKTEEIAAWAAVALVAAAADRQELPAESVAHVQRRLGSVAAHWHDVAQQYGWVRRLGPMVPDPQVWTASRALASAVAAATYTVNAPTGGYGRATAATISARFAGTELVPMLQTIAESSVILAELYQRIPTRAHRRDVAGNMRPAFYAPEHILRDISLKQHALNSPGGGDPGTNASPHVLDIPITGRVDRLRPMSTPASSILRAAGENLARAAASAEQAIELAAGVRPRWGSGGLAPTYSPASPAPPSQLSPGTTTATTPGTTPGPGIPR